MRSNAGWLYRLNSFVVDLKKFGVAKFDSLRTYFRKKFLIINNLELNMYYTPSNQLYMLRKNM